MNESKTALTAFIANCQANIEEMHTKLESPHCRKRTQWAEGIERNLAAIESARNTLNK